LKAFQYILLFVLIGLVIAQINKARRFKVKKLPFNYNAITVPPIGIFIQDEDFGNETLLNHELVHWEQYQRNGLLMYYIRYFAQMAFQGYDNSTFEIEARQRTGEKPECIRNYTECVRNGTALTVHDPNFRI